MSNKGAVATESDEAGLDAEPPRIRPRALLPFRAETAYFCGRPVTGLTWEVNVLLPDGVKRLPLTCHVDGDAEAAGLASDPKSSMGARVLDLMRMYYALETENQGLLKQLDDALAEVALLRGQNRTLAGRVEQYDRTAVRKGR